MSVLGTILTLGDVCSLFLFRGIVVDRNNLSKLNWVSIRSGEGGGGKEVTKKV